MEDIYLNKKFNYSVLIPPLSKEIKDLNEDEANEFFKWYQTKIPERINYLSNVCADYYKIKREEMKFEPDRLTYIWKWFLNVAEIEEKHSPKIKRKPFKVQNRKKQFQYEFENLDSKKLSLQTEYILRDIGMYIGQMFVDYHPQIYWNFYTEPKTDLFVNQPLLLGFKDKEFMPPFPMEFEPIHMVGVQAAKLLDGSQKETDLLYLYEQWSRFI